MINIFNISKIIKRLDTMIDNAIDGKNTDTVYDETKMSALENKLNRYLVISKTKADIQADEKNKINSLISDISHQTKTPLANIMLYSQLLAEKNNIDPQTQRLIHEISSQSEKLNFLISSLIRMSRLEAGIITANRTTNAVYPFLQKVIEDIKNKADIKNIEISVRRSGDGGENIKAVFDEKWTAEAILNILDNAVKYSYEGGKIELSVIRYEMFTRIDIKDFGIGISEDEINLIFQRFYRSAAVSGYEGIGIGLYLAREIISMQGGYIKATSEPPGNVIPPKNVFLAGTTFSVFLPNK